MSDLSREVLQQRQLGICTMRTSFPVLTLIICLMLGSTGLDAATFSQREDISVTAGGLAVIDGVLGDPDLTSADISFTLPSPLRGFSISDVNDAQIGDFSDSNVTTFDDDPNVRSFLSTGIDSASFNNDDGKIAFTLFTRTFRDQPGGPIQLAGPSNVVELLLRVPQSGSFLVAFDGEVNDGQGLRAVNGSFTVVAQAAAVIPLPGAVGGFCAALLGLWAVALRRRTRGV